MRHGSLVCALACLSLPSFGSAPSLAASAPRGSPASVRVTLERRESGDRRLVVVVRVNGEGLVLGSYSGRVRFNPREFVVDSTLVGSDGSRYVNGNEAARGTLRFAGFTTTGFTSDVALRIVGHTTAAGTVPRFSALLDVAGNLAGTGVPRDSLIGSGESLSGRK